MPNAQAAALYIAGFERDSRLVMAKFKWGDSFFQLNGEYLDRYAACADSAEVIKVQNEIMVMIETERTTRAADKAADTQNDYGGNFGIESSSEEEYEYYTTEPEPQPEEIGAFGLGQLADAEAKRLARLQRIAPSAPPAVVLMTPRDGGEDDLQGAIDDDFGVDLEGTNSADTTWSLDPAWDAMPKILTPAVLNSGGDNSPKSYPAPAAPPSAYSPPATGDLVDVPVKSVRPGLVFDDSWMYDVPEGGCSVIGEFKDDDDVLDKIDERAEEAKEMAAAAVAASVLDEI